MKFYLKGQFALILSKLCSFTLPSVIKFRRLNNGVLLQFSKGFRPFNSFLLTISFDRILLQSRTSHYIFPKNGKIEHFYSKPDNLNDHDIYHRSMLSFYS